MRTTLASCFCLAAMAALIATAIEKQNPCASDNTVTYKIPVKQMPHATAKVRLIEALHQSLANDESHKLDLVLEKDIQRLSKEIREEK